MRQDRRPESWKRTARPVRPDFATLVAAAVARQAASPTARIVAASDAGPVQALSLIELFGEKKRRGSASAASFNESVAARLSPAGET